MRSDFSILTVCTGNVCRSPLAEALIRQELTGIGDVTVASAGIRAVVGEPMNHRSRRFAAMNGVNSPERHYARQITPGLVERSDLILTMTRRHRRYVAELCPRATRRMFTLREFARLADVAQESGLRYMDWSRDLSDTERLRHIVETIPMARGFAAPPSEPDGDDVVDLYRSSSDVWEQSTGQISHAVDAVVMLLKRAAEGPI